MGFEAFQGIECDYLFSYNRAKSINSLSNQENKAVAILKFHTKPITSVEWNINDSTVFAASGEDNQITIWDLSVEKDDEQIDGITELSFCREILTKRGYLKIFNH